MSSAFYVLYIYCIGTGGNRDSTVLMKGKPHLEDPDVLPGWPRRRSIMHGPIVDHQFNWGHTACCTFHVSETRMNFLVLFCIKSPSNKSRLEDSRGPGSSAHYSLRAQRGLRAEEQNLFPVEGHVNGGYYKGTPNHLPFHLNACSTSSSVVRREPLQHDTVKVHFRYRTNRTNLPESVPPISFRGITFTYLHLP